MREDIKPGLSYTIKKKVTLKDTAAFYGSGLHEVFSTPAMIALMEGTSLKVVEKYLDEDEGTVGTEVHVKHLKSTPVGMEVTCTAVLINVDDRRLTFSVEAFNETEKIGEGTHERFIINNKRFREKNSKI
ncbi:MAG TPA: thioesterase family protein [Bacteroidales bacterium]|nr:thioesterase family protein [Bacteroidales bacterium]